MKHKTLRGHITTVKPFLTIKFKDTDRLYFEHNEVTYCPKNFGCLYDSKKKPREVWVRFVREN